MPIPFTAVPEFESGLLQSTTSRSLLSRNTNGTIGLFDATNMVTGSGTLNTVPLWGAGGTLGDSIITQSGTTSISISGRLSTSNFGASFINGHRGFSAYNISTIPTSGNWNGWVAQRTVLGGFNIGTINEALEVTYATSSNIDNNINDVVRPLIVRADGVIVQGICLLGTTANTGERLQVNGTARISTVDNLAGHFVTWNSSTGRLTHRTAAETRGDIGAIGGSGTVNTVPLWGTGGSLGNSIITQPTTEGVIINGKLGVASVISANRQVNIAGNYDQDGHIGVQVIGNLNGDKPNGASYVRVLLNQQSGSVSTLSGYQVDVQGTVNATNIHGFNVGNSTQGTNFRAFRGGVNSGTGRWNIFMDGTADNHLAGNLGIGTTSTASSRLTISGGSQISSSNGNAYNLQFSTNVTGRRSAELVAQIGTFDNNSAIELGAGNSGAAIYLGGNNVTGGSEIRLWTANSLRMRFTSDGRIGFGNYTSEIQVNGRFEFNTAASGAWFTRLAGDAGVTRAAFTIGTTDTQVRLSAYGEMQFFTGALGATPAVRGQITAGGNWLLNTTTDTGERLQVNGIARISTVDNLAGNFVTWNNSTGRLTHRTAAETRGDIGAVGGSGTVNTVPLWTSSTGLGNSIITQVASNQISISGRLNVNSVNATRIALIDGSILGNGVIGLDVLTRFSTGSSGSGAGVSSLVTVSSGVQLTTLQMYRAQSTSFEGTSTTGNRFVFDGSIAASAGVTAIDAAFRAFIGAGTNRWSLYMDGPAPNYLTGFLRIGSLATPTSPLEISGGGGVAQIKIERTSPVPSGGIGALVFGAAGVATAGISSQYGATTNDSDLRFYAGTPNSNIYAVAERMRIRQDGAVLIGTIVSSGERLRVNGTVRIDTVDEAAGDFLTRNATTNRITRRTAAQVIGDIGAWSTSGNAPTVDTTFLGTTNARSFDIRTNNLVRMSFLSGGAISIASPASTNSSLNIGGSLSLFLGGSLTAPGITGDSTVATNYLFLNPSNQVRSRTITQVKSDLGIFDSVHNQNSVYQLANFRIAGLGRFGSDSAYAEIGASSILSNQNYSIRTPRLYISNNDITSDLSGSTYRLIVDSGTTSGNGLYVKGRILATNNATAFSDQRLKKDISRLENADLLYFIDAKKYLYAGKRAVGFIAQDVQKFFPALVNKEDNGYLSLDYIGMIPYIVEFIKSDRDRILELEREVGKLKFLIKNAS